MKIFRVSLYSAAVVLLAVSLAAAGTTSTHAQTSRATIKTTGPAPPGGRPAVDGTIRSAAGSLLTVTVSSTHKSAKIHLTSKTRYLVNGKSSTKHPTWKTGDRVQVTGTKQKDGSYIASSVMVGTPPASAGGPPAGVPPGSPPGGSLINGTVVSFSSSSLTVKDSKGAKTTVHITSGTHYIVNGKNVSKRPALKSGEQIHTMAATSGKAKTAQTIIVGSMPVPPSGAPGQGPQP